MSGVVTVRPFAVTDLAAAARFGEAGRALDPAIEPFAQRLALLANGPRAALALWRVAAGEDGGVYGLSFAAVRDAAQPVYDFYAAVHPSLRRQGLGRALGEAAVVSGAALRARVRDDALPGIAFLRALGFAENGAQLFLQWAGGPIKPPATPTLRIRPASRRDEAAVQALSREAWAGAPDAFAPRADEIAQLFSGDDRLVLLAESDGKPMGYLSAVQLGRTLGIEEVAVLPQFRRTGIARALVARALTNTQGAVLSVGESNRPARGLYRALGFRQVARRLVMQRPREAGSARA
jgi:ribosomal protein S18 acetylase RimI-like enzyme